MEYSNVTGQLRRFPLVNSLATTLNNDVTIQYMDDKVTISISISKKMPNIGRCRAGIGSIWKNWYRPILTNYCYCKEKLFVDHRNFFVS